MELASDMNEWKNILKELKNGTLSQAYSLEKLYQYSALVLFLLLQLT